MKNLKFAKNTFILYDIVVSLEIVLDKKNHITRWKFRRKQFTDDKYIDNS